MITQKIKASIVKLGLFIALLTSLFSLCSVGTTFALSPASNVTNFGTASTDAACSALSSLDSSQGCGSGKNGGAVHVDDLIMTIVNIISLVAGVIAVIMIVLSGIRFMTSGGDPNKVGSAKSSLIYALIGLVVVALTQVIIHFTLNNASRADPAAAPAVPAKSSFIEIIKP